MSDKAVYRIKGKNLTVDDLNGVQIDGKDVEKGNYVAENGSIKITFKKSYVDTLSLGSHDITFNTKKGIAKAELVIKDKSQVNSNSGMDKGNTAKTGDNTNFAGFAGLLIATMGIYVSVKRRKI